MGGQNQNNYAGISAQQNRTTGSVRQPTGSAAGEPSQIVLCGFRRLHAAGMERLVQDIDRPVEVRSQEQTPTLPTADLVIVNLQKDNTSHFGKLLTREPTSATAPVLALYDPGHNGIAENLLQSRNQVRGVLPANASVTTLILTIKAMLHGKTVDPISASVKCATASQQSGPREATVVNENGKAIKLTPRQMQVLESLAQGKPNKIIARDLKVSENTIKAHLKSVFRILGASNRTEAVAHASRLNLEIG